MIRVIKLSDYKLTKKDRARKESIKRVIVACDQYWGKNKPPTNASPTKESG